MPRKKIVPDANVAETGTQQPNAEAEAVRPVPVKRKAAKPALTPTTFVTVRNGFNGQLIYKSPHTGEQFVWDSFGAEQDMELQELRNARNSYKSYFENNWFLFDDPAIIEYLGVQRFYEGSLLFSEFDSIFTLPPDELRNKLSLMPRGQKESLKYRACQLVSQNKIDSLSVIRTLESGLGISLTEY